MASILVVCNGNVCRSPLGEGFLRRAMQVHGDVPPWSVLLCGFAVWLVIVVVETLHGIARKLLLEPRVRDLRARQIAVFTGSILILAIALAFVRWLRTTSALGLLAVGLLWVVLIVAFEIVLGRLVLGYPWERIASDYNLLRGGLMPIGLVVLALAPLLPGKLRGITRKAPPRRPS